STLYGMKVSLRGIELSREAANSTYAMCSLIADNVGCALFSTFFECLDARVGFSDADVLTLGCDYQEGVFWALNLAAWMRSRGSTAHICIARHGFENFSLLHHIDRLVQNEWFFGLVDSVILHDEELPSTLAALARALNDGNLEGLDNIAIKPKEGAPRVLPLRPGAAGGKRRAPAEYHIPHDYFQSMDVPLENIVYSMCMVRNKCFYKKCTFCVQITKHLSDAAFEPSTETERAIAACDEVVRHGVRLVNFMDEAMRPVDLRRFSEALLDRKIPVRWVGRMIAAAHPDEATLRLMHEAGCVEILFGIESFEPAVLRGMGKISGRRETSDETLGMIRSYLDAGMFVILSMIYDFPAENAAARATTRALAGQIADPSRIAYIFNRFALFDTSQVFKDPARFGIGAVEERPAHNDIQYAFAYSRHSDPEPVTAQEITDYQALKFGIAPQRHAALVARRGAALLDMAHSLDYNSIGFVHRVARNTTLLASLLEMESV
ncbi:MAG TPA: radical SAM protein, partial [Chthoniobacteraceae bacterium]|nr:radical SAM protein [Chthoniobacteraceae bacterium]